MTIVFPALILIALFAYLFLRRNSERRGIDSGNDGHWGKNPWIWVFVLMTLSAIDAFISALQEGWNIGDTIGACVFFVLSVLILPEAVRRNRNARNSRNPK
ncbi:MAG: hypothetical protein ABI693_05050 [Bryobacteraceae bacterium]